MKAILAILVLVVVATATQEEVLATIKKIDSTRFGRTLFDTIWLQLEAQEPLDRLLSTLTDLEDRYHEEQKEDDSKHGDFQGVCNYDIASYDKDLAEANTHKITLEARLEGALYPQRDIVTVVVRAKEKELAGYQADVNNLDEDRNSENDEFEQKVREHEEATAIISEARRIFTENLQGGHGDEALIQRGKVSAKAFVTVETTILAQKHFLTSAKRASKFVHRKAYAKVFKVLATIASKAHQLAPEGGVQRIVDLCDEILTKISDSLDLERFAEDKRVQAYKAARHLLVVTINAVQSSLANAQSELASLVDQIAQTETSLENTNQRIAIKSEERQDRYDQCEQEALDYQDSRAQRDADRSTVSETLGLVNAQLRTLREQLALRMSAGDKFD